MRLAAVVDYWLLDFYFEKTQLERKRRLSHMSRIGDNCKFRIAFPHGLFSINGELTSYF